MTTQILDTVEALDLSDLDLLDDLRRHCFCIPCCGGRLPVVGVFIAICGTQALARATEVLEDPPAACCDVCAERFHQPCPECGQ
jgi:hypothetical protein